MSTIFITDDEAPLLRILRIVLRDEFEGRHSVQAFTAADHALEVLRSYRDEGLPLPEYILSDVDMPRMDGKQFHAILKAEGMLAETRFALWSGAVDLHRDYCEQEGILLGEKGGGLDEILAFLHTFIGE